MWDAEESPSDTENKTTVFIFMEKNAKIPCNREDEVKCLN